MNNLSTIITAALVFIGIILFGFGLVGGSSSAALIGVIFLGGAILFSKIARED